MGNRQNVSIVLLEIYPNFYPWSVSHLPRMQKMFISEIRNPKSEIVGNPHYTPNWAPIPLFCQKCQ